MGRTLKNQALRRIAIALFSFAAAVLLSFLWLGYLDKVPFTLVQPAGVARRDVTAILLSGDMGFRVGMGPRIASRLAADGIPVVGVNSLTYFRTTRTPAQATALIQAAIGRARAAAPGRKLLLIGQSYGADMLHVGLAGLPRAQRADIAMVALVVPGATVEYRASPAEILTFAMPEADAMPTARQLDWTPTLCLSGREESASLCPLLRQPNVHAFALPGGHPLHYDADAVYRQIVAEMARAGIAPSANPGG